MGRTCFSDVIRNSRTAGRLIWFHVPPRLTPKAPNETENSRSTQELIKVMAEKRMARFFHLHRRCVTHNGGRLWILLKGMLYSLKTRHFHQHVIQIRRRPEAPYPRYGALKLHLCVANLGFFRRNRNLLRGSLRPRPSSS
jgi:hypothetical protein